MQCSRIHAFRCRETFCRPGLSRNDRLPDIESSASEKPKLHAKHDNDVKSVMLAASLSNDMIYSYQILGSSRVVKGQKEESLEDAQMRKFDRVTEDAMLKQLDHVLEICTVRSSFAIRIVQKTTCRITFLPLNRDRTAWRIDALP
jgi:cyclopropane fatty-acyl-phospholipid synthase-like methyltransferase